MVIDTAGVIKGYWPLQLLGYAMLEAQHNCKLSVNDSIQQCQRHVSACLKFKISLDPRLIVVPLRLLVTKQRENVVVVSPVKHLLYLMLTGRQVTGAILSAILTNQIARIVVRV